MFAGFQLQFLSKYCTWCGISFLPIRSDRVHRTCSCRNVNTWPYHLSYNLICLSLNNSATALGTLFYTSHSIKTLNNSAFSLFLASKKMRKYLRKEIFLPVSSKKHRRQKNPKPMPDTLVAYFLWRHKNVWRPQSKFEPLSFYPSFLFSLPLCASWTKLTANVLSVSFLCPSLCWNPAYSMKLLLYVFREGKKLIVTQVVEQWAMIPKASVRIPPEDQHFFFFFSSEKNSSEIRQQL